MLSTFKSVMVGVMALAITSAAAAQGKGTSPSGKPFVEINGQIVAVEGEVGRLDETLTEFINEVIPRIESLEGKVETLEDAKLVTEQVLLELQAEETRLQDLLASTDASLQTEIDELQAQIDRNAGMIELMQDELTSLHAMLEAKQNVINGLCADGSAISQVNEDGSVICATANGTASGYTKVQKTIGGWMNATSKETLTCNPNSVPVSTSVYSYRQFCWWRPTVRLLWGWLPVPWLVYTCEDPNLNVGEVYSEVISPVPGGSARFHGSLFSATKVTTLSVMCAELAP